MKNITNNIIKFPHFGPETKEGPKEWDDLDGLEIGYDRVVSKVFLDEWSEGWVVNKNDDELTFIYDIVRPVRDLSLFDPTFSLLVKDMVVQRLFYELRKMTFQVREDDFTRITGVQLIPEFTFNHEERLIVDGGIEWSTYHDPIIIDQRRKLEGWNLNSMVFDSYRLIGRREKRSWGKWRKEFEDNGSYPGGIHEVFGPPHQYIKNYGLEK